MKEPLYCQQLKLNEQDPTKDKWPATYMRATLQQLSTPLDLALIGKHYCVLEIEGDHSKVRLEFGLDDEGDGARVALVLRNLAHEIISLADKVEEETKDEELVSKT